MNDMAHWFTLPALIQRAKFEIRRLVSSHPRLFLPFVRRRAAYAGKVVGDNTEIVLEGFPRSGNTFALVAFEMAQDRDVHVAHHLHAPAQIIEGVRLGLPVVLLIRNPIDAVSSFVIRHPDLTVKAGLRAYTSFYRHVLPCREDIVVAPFERVTADFGAVIDAVNRRFGTRFARFEQTPENVEAVFRILNRKEQADVSRRSAGTESGDTIARPTDQRDAAKERLFPLFEASEVKMLVQQAREVHRAFLQ